MLTTGPFGGYNDDPKVGVYLPKGRKLSTTVPVYVERDLKKAP